MIDPVTRIPIKNLYYLLLYAWNRLEEASLVEVSPDCETKLINLFSRIILSGTQRLLKQGLDRGYHRFREETRCPRGKLLFGNGVKRMLEATGTVCCEYDELDYQVLHNRILKTTIYHLVSHPDIDPSLRGGLSDLNRRLRVIDAINLSADVFARVQLHRNNAFYGFLIDVCEIIYNYCLVSQNAGESKFRDFIRDEKRMPRLFEDFLRNFYKIELEGAHPGYRVFGAQQIHWDGQATRPEDARYLPVMTTDISLATPDRHLIIDAKYYKKALLEHYGEKLHSANLYQLFAYLKNIEAIGPTYHKCSGLLIYPTVQQTLDLEYILQGHFIAIKTIDLTQEWIEIHSHLLRMVGVSG